MSMAVLHCDYCLYIKNHYVILIEISFGIFLLSSQIKNSELMKTNRIVQIIIN